MLGGEGSVTAGEGSKRLGRIEVPKEREKSMHIQELARRLEAKVDDGADVEITGVATIEDAEEGEVTFLSNPRYARLLNAGPS